MFGLGIWELLILFLIVLLLFGANRLPEIGSSLGRGIREFKDSIEGTEPGGESGEREELPGDEDRSRRG